jgi:hypothetical protein
MKYSYDRRGDFGTRKLRDALPPEAGFVGKLGPNEIWTTGKWDYLVQPNTPGFPDGKKVLNVVRIKGQRVPR